MTNDEATLLVGKLRSVAPLQDLDRFRLDAMEEVLRPLPFAVCNQRITAWALEPATDKDGKRAAKWVSTPDDVLAAVGVGDRARRLLHRAMTEGRELWPSLREDGWEVVEPDGELPRGVGEWHVNLSLPLPSGRRVSLALPAAPATTATEPTNATAALTSIGATLQERKNGALRRAFEQRQHPPAPFVPDRNAMPPVLREAVEAAEAAGDRALQAARSCAAQERAYREMCAEMTDRIRDGAPDNETARAVAVELLERLAADPGYGLVACVEALRDALMPGAEVAVKPEYGPNPDEFADGPGPLVALRVGLRKS